MKLAETVPFRAKINTAKRVSPHDFPTISP